jgi:hypothetical protein
VIERKEREERKTFEIATSPHFVQEIGGEDASSY